MAVLPDYITCIRRVGQVATLSEQFLKIINNPYLTQKTFDSLLASLHDPVHSFHEFIQHVIACTEGEVRQGVWTMTTLQYKHLTALTKYLKDKSKGDSIWKRNQNAVIGMGHCDGLLIQLYGMRALLGAKLNEILNHNTSSLSSSSPTSSPTESPILEALVGELQKVAALLTEMIELAEILRGKVHHFKAVIDEDRFLGTPFIYAEGESLALDSKEIHDRIHLNCYDNSKLWDLINTLNNECKRVFQQLRGILLQEDSSLSTLLANPMATSAESLLNAFIADLTLQSNQTNSMYYLQQFKKNLRAVTSSDRFVTTVDNPNHLKPDSEEYSSLLIRANALREQLESNSLHAIMERQRQLEAQLADAESRKATLQRDLLEMRNARDQLVVQLSEQMNNHPVYSNERTRVGK